MAVVNTKSTAVTNADNATQANTSSKLVGGKIKQDIGVIEATSGDSIGSTYRFSRLKSGAVISRILLSCDAITTCAGDIGVYETAANGGAAVDADFFASAQSLAAALVNTDVTHEADAADAAAGFGLSDVEKPLWQGLGLTADPMKQYDLAITLTAAAGSAGTMVLKTQYCDGN